MRMKPLFRNRLAIGLALVALGGSLAFGACPSAAIKPPTKEKPPTAPAAVSYHTDVVLSVEKIGSQETALGGFVAEAIRDAAHAEVAFIPAAAFNLEAPPISPGPFTPNDLVQMLDFRSETIAVVKLTGAQIRRALNHAFVLYPQENSSFLQFAGLVVTVNPNGDDQNRVVAIKVGDQPLQDSQTYRVAMPLTLANGALAYFKYWQKSDIVENLDTTLEQAIKEYLKSHPIITKEEERLVQKP